MNSCRICQNTSGNRLHSVREMLLGFRDEFDYLECAECGCLQIMKIPINLDKYYPKSYYSYLPAKPGIEYRHKGIRSLKERFIIRQITKYYLNHQHHLGRWFESRSCLVEFYPLWLRTQGVNLKLNLDSSVLDIGCGSGKFLLELELLGMSNLSGIDPFIECDLAYPNGVRVFKKDVMDADGKFDFIMLNHSFEHMPDPISVLKKVHNLLKPERYVLIRIPIADSYAWRTYGVNWYALDAPRHLFLHTRRSMQLLAREASFHISEVSFDANGVSHWASDLYRRDIPIVDVGNGDVPKRYFSERQLDEFEKFDFQLNHKGEADNACFYLYKPHELNNVADSQIVSKKSSSMPKHR